MTLKRTRHLNIYITINELAEEHSDYPISRLCELGHITRASYYKWKTKGVYGHFTADYIAEYYGSPDPFAVTEMEEIAVANTAECFDMLDRVISFRAIVNLDVFLADETPESTWGEYSGFNEKVTEENSETFDIFEPAMHNLFDTASVVIDAILDGQM